MPHIANTNIIVDDFRYSARNSTFSNYIFFLSHMHADHYRGISNGFRTGKIFTSKITGRLLAAKYPGVAEMIIPLENNKPYKLVLNEKSGLYATVVFMDANHIIGSSMILFMGYFGTVLYSGDLRYHDKLLKTNSFLFTEDGIKFPVDELILDNTYCDPIFAFPSQMEAVEIIRGIIAKHLEESGAALKVRIYCYTIGKEELCIELAKIFNTKIVLEPERLRYIKAANFFPELFTLDETKGFIRLTSGVNRKDKELLENTIHINLTGWINCKDSMSMKKNEYLVAYSSHSNFPELSRFVSIVKPGVLRNIVIEKDDKLDIKKVKSLLSYFFYLKNFKQRGLPLLSRLIRGEVL